MAPYLLLIAFVLMVFVMASIVQEAWELWQQRRESRTRNMARRLR